MGQLKFGDSVKVLNVDGKRILDRFNGLTGIYCGEDIFGGHLVKVVYSGEPIIIAVDDVEPIGNTLLEILVDELPKRGGWRDGAGVCIQDSCKAIKFNSRHSTLTMNEFGNWESKPDAFNNYGWVGANLLGFSDLATDYATRIVTREEYEQAVKPTRFEQSVKAANELALVMLENMAQRLTDACSQREEAPVEKKLGISFAGIAPTKEAKDVDTEILNPDYLPELDRIRKLREERDLAEKKYSSQFVSGEIEIRKLNLGDKIIFERDSLGIVMEVTKVVRGIFEHECHLQGLPPHAAFVSVLTIHDVSRFAKVS
ncbi:MAG: hypothetical protein ACRCVE_02120 [Plesiomonas sp.]